RGREVERDQEQLHVRRCYVDTPPLRRALPPHPLTSGRMWRNVGGAREIGPTRRYPCQPAPETPCRPSTPASPRPTKPCSRPGFRSKSCPFPPPSSPTP